MLKAKLISALMFLILFLSCRSIPDQSQQHLIHNFEAEKPKILFVEYRFFKTKSGTIKAELTSKIPSEGQLKSATDNDTSADFELRQLNSDKTILDRIPFSNPLTETIEFIDNTNAWQKKTVDYNEKKVFYRFQLHNTTKFLQIVNLTSDNETIIALNSL